MQRSSFLAGSVPPGARRSASTASGSAAQYVASSGASSAAPNAAALCAKPSQSEGFRLYGSSAQYVTASQRPCSRRA